MKPKAAGWFSSDSRWFQTRVSIESFRDYHGGHDVEYYLLFCGSDRDFARISVPDYVNVVYPGQMHEHYVSRMATIGTMGGFPRCLIADYMMRQGHERIMTFDGDIEFLASLEDLWDILTGYNAYVTPHRIYPPPLDGKYPTIESLGLSGNYNSAVCGFRNTAESRSFVLWWLKQSCDFPEIDGERCRYAEQGWLRFIGDYLENVAIVRDQGVNFAWWRHDNEGMFRRKNERFEVFDASRGKWSQLRAMHYSHVPFKSLNQVAACQNRSKAGPDFLAFLQRYSDRVHLTT